MTTRPRDRIAEINQDAAAFYRTQLLAPRNDGPRKYLAGRRFDQLLEDTPWTVGYAPDSWTSLHGHLARSGYSDENMLEAGLISISRRGTPIDRFRNRLTFGVRDADTTLVGFVCRAAPTASDNTPKYLNTPRTPAYDKSSVLFGLGEALSRADTDTTVVVEGPLDAIAVSLSDPSEWTPVALCGSSITPKHVQEISRLRHPVVLSFDEDPAGHRALERAAATLTSDIGEPRAASLALGQDPSGLFADLGPKALQEALQDAKPVTDLILDRLLQTDITHNAERALLVLREAARSLARIGMPDMARNAVRLSEALALDTFTVTRELAAAQASSGHGASSARIPNAVRLHRRRGEVKRTFSAATQQDNLASALSAQWGTLVGLVGM